MFRGIGAVVIGEPGEGGFEERGGRAAFARQQGAQHAGKLLRLEFAFPPDFLQQAFGLLDRRTGERERGGIEAAMAYGFGGGGRSGRGRQKQGQGKC